jgi:hypothetical protein
MSALSRQRSVDAKTLVSVFPCDGRARTAGHTIGAGEVGCGCAFAALAGAVSGDYKGDALKDSLTCPCHRAVDTTELQIEALAAARGPLCVFGECCGAHV